MSAVVEKLATLDGAILFSPEGEMIAYWFTHIEI